MKKNYQDLDVYRRSYSLSLEINKLAEELPQKEHHILGNQIKKASCSVPFNIIGGFGKKEHVKDFLSSIHVALGSNTEMILNLKLMNSLNYLPNQNYQRFLTEYTIVGKQLGVLIKSWRKFIK